MKIQIHDQAGEVARAAVQFIAAEARAAVAARGRFVMAIQLAAGIRPETKEELCASE